ncbi:S-layer homology domain-containing protein [Psychrobacillus sp. NPDC096623]|uniref:S-layer homology domain-containing protein n=1 Tax=Psychrobacillus sp. NPDC096623 TaxID=3364492 RepID=UPI0037F84D29
MKRLLHGLMAVSLSLAIFVIPAVSAIADGFPDVASFNKEIDYLTELKVINGYSDGTFRPSAKLTRAQAVVMIMRSIGMPESVAHIKDPGYYDVTQSSFGYKEILVASSAGIISGKSKTHFDPTGHITRAEMAKVVGNAFKLEGVYELGFKDVSRDYWASSYISSLATNNITVGYNDGTFRPTQPIDRAQFSAFLARIMKPNFRPSTGKSAHSILDLAVESSSIVDLVKHPHKPIVYYIDGKSKSLVMLNVETKSKKVVELTHPAEKLVIKNGKIFVTQLIQARSPYNFMETQKGLINVYEAEDLSFLKAVNVNIDPFDIAVDDAETLIISSGSDQGISSEIHTYNWQTSEHLSSANLFPQQLIELSPTQNKVYSVASSHYTGKMETFSLREGKISKETMVPRFFNTMKLRGYTQMSPDGNVIYNGDGTAYASSSIPSEDLAPLGRLATPFTTMTFDETGKNIYLADQSEQISVYKYNTLDPTSNLRAYGKIDRLVYVEETEELYAFTKFKHEGAKTESILLERFKFGK